VTPTREILWNINAFGRVAIYALLILPFAFLTFGLARRVYMWRKGRPADRFGQWGARLKTALAKSVLHGRIVRERKLYAGTMHACIFSGFVLLFIGTLIVMLEDDITRPIFNYSFYRGDFYLGYKLVMNLAGLLLIAGVLMALYRRYVLRPVIQETAADDVILLCFLLTLTVQGFVLQAVRLAVQPQPWARWSFVSYPMSVPLRAVSNGLLENVHAVNWWAHFLTTFVFLGYFAYSKMSHVFVSLTNVVFRRLEPLGRIDAIPDIENADVLGIGKLADLSWAQLMNVDACMHCGRCLEFCPTFNTSKPLRPRDLVLELAGFVADNGGIFSGEIGEGQNSARFRSGVGPDRPLIGGVVMPAELWDCTTCGACMEHCPVYIEHVPLIVGMRQNLVLEQNSFPDEVGLVFNNLERFNSPYAVPATQRADWTRKLSAPVRTMAEAAAKDEPVEVLFFVGCLGSFDPRNQQTTLALARILQTAGINFAILGKEETCTGDPARRIGNEYLAQMMAQQTVETLNAYTFKKIVTACPHCFNSLANEYPQIGGHFEVVHHSQLIAQLLEAGRLQLDPTSAVARGKVTYHDPCYLGRYNGVYDEPRGVVAALPGAELTEMRRNRNKSFCCGGGGGRLFMEETRGTRINQARVREAIDTGAEVLCAACPFCMTMFEDGIRGVGADETFQVKDIAELVAAALVTPQVAVPDPE
jgi:Fe-S oxidoreductase/nitrate reductase gamma subunit